MYWVETIIFLLSAVGIIFVCDFRLDDINALLSRPHKSKLKSDIAILIGKPQTGLRRQYSALEQQLAAAGHGDKVAAVTRISIILFAVGTVILLLCNNVYLIPILAAACILAPIWYMRAVSDKYKRRLSDQLESALSIITTSYLRTEDIIASVQENLNYISDPLKSVFRSFITEARLIDANTVSTLHNLKLKLPNSIAREWCDVLIQCQTDRTLKYLLTDTIKKFSDVRLAQSELDSILNAPKREAIMMMGLVLVNIPLLYLLNQDWYRTLLFTTPGKVTLAVCGAILLYALTRVMQLSKPIEYRGAAK